jgi:exopolyphosphatase/guanosine-5'-triphosphate,3'-diphosphate pyrophosphatase
MRLAVFDLGTNVFNLLIAWVSKDKCDIKKVVKVGSHIGKGGFFNRELTQEAIDTSMEAIGEMCEVIEQEGGVDLTKAFATSAFRDASNGAEFARLIGEKHGIDVEIISGDREAELIYKGVRESVLLYDEKVLILDIGGGSNEFIIADKERIYWKESFPLGVVRMKEIISPSNPISADEILRYKNYLDISLQTLFEQVAIYKPIFMIGCSGSFDTLRELIWPEDNGTLPALELPLDKFLELNDTLVKSTSIERHNMKRMSPMRVDYMVLGSIFVEYIIKKFEIKELYQSSYSLKEGYMSEIASSL